MSSHGIPDDFLRTLNALHGKAPPTDDELTLFNDQLKDALGGSFASHGKSSSNDIDMSKRRLDPDPVSILLAALGALGSVASLAAYVEHKRDKKAKKTKARRTVLRAIASLREAIAEVERSLYELEKLLGQYDQATQSSRSVLEAPADFGACPPLFDFFEFSVYQMIGQRVTRAFDQCVADTYEVMDGIEDGALEVPQELFAELGELQARLNALRYERRPIAQILSGTRHVAQKMVKIIEDLERCIVFDRAS